MHIEFEKGYSEEIFYMVILSKRYAEKEEVTGRYGKYSKAGKEGAIDLQTADKRDRCYHAISRDTSCRPHEILKLRINDVVFETAGQNCQYTEVLGKF